MAAETGVGFFAEFARNRPRDGSRGVCYLCKVNSPRASNCCVDIVIHATGQKVIVPFVGEQGKSNLLDDVSTKTEVQRTRA